MDSLTATQTQQGGNQDSDLFSLMLASSTHRPNIMVENDSGGFVREILRNIGWKPSLITFCCLGAGLGLYVYQHRPRWAQIIRRHATDPIEKLVQSNVETDVYDDAEDCIKILATDGVYDIDGVLRKNNLPKLASRAAPNQRLQHAFGICNSFTTNDENIHRAFKTQATKLLKNYKNEWSSTAQSARQFIHSQLQDADTVDIFKLIQTVTMRLSLSAVHGVDLTTVSNTRVHFLATEINRLWVASKKASTLEPWSDQADIHQTLTMLVPNTDPLNPAENPLNLILPSYETLWRVVLRCFVEINFRKHPDTANGGENNNVLKNDYWIQALRAFVKDPSVDNLNKRTEFGASPGDIAKEALRVYPPTRRVYRLFRYEGDAQPREVAADLESYQRKPVNEQSQSDHEMSIFNPEFWMTESTQTDEEFLAFGASPFTCPAKTEFAYRAIATLVGALTIEVGTDWTLSPNLNDSLPASEPMDTDREAYSELKLRRKEKKGEEEKEVEMEMELKGAKEQ
ncbi:MAG: hypothetical protein M1820_006104 [Bogoriella megaspora]|nr:MAG: hypothetical protein M1820_006104 [Bogoriella megaspora]